jgi:hypothetical protein
LKDTAVAAARKLPLLIKSLLDGKFFMIVDYGLLKTSVHMRDPIFEWL